MIPAQDGNCQLDKSTWKKVKGSTGDFFVIEDLDEESLRKDLKFLKNMGIESLAVVLAHSYA